MSNQCYHLIHFFLTKRLNLLFVTKMFFHSTLRSKIVKIEHILSFKILHFTLITFLEIFCQLNICRKKRLA